MMGMGAGILAAIAELEKENANLQPELLTAERARELMTAYARAGKLVSFGIAALSRKLDDSSELARLTGSSVGRAKNVVNDWHGHGLFGRAELCADAWRHLSLRLTRSQPPRSRLPGLLKSS